MTATAVARGRRPLARRVGRLLRRALMMELHGYQSIYRFVFRRPRVPTGAAAFGYHQPVLAILIVFVVISAVELVVVDIIVRPWPVVRVSFIVLGLWGLVFMLGLLFGILTRPHSVGPDGIRVRSGTEIDIALPWTVVYSVARRRLTVQDRQPKLSTDDNGEVTLHLRIQHETNLELRLEQPTDVRLPHGTETVSKINLYADDPKGFLAEVRRHIG